MIKYYAAYRWIRVKLSLCSLWFLNAFFRISFLLFPVAWSKFSENIRRCLTNRFPYGVIYQIIIEEVLIIAVMQLNKNQITGKRE